MSKKEISEAVRLRIAENIKKALETAGLERKQAAAALNMSYERFNNYVNGFRCMSEDVALDFAKLTKTDAFNFMDPETIKRMKTDKNKTVLKNHYETVNFLEYLGYQINASAAEIHGNHPGNDMLAPALMLTDLKKKKKIQAEYRAKNGYDNMDPEKKLTLDRAFHASNLVARPVYIQEKELNEIESEISEAVRNIIDRHIKNHFGGSDIRNVLLSMDFYCNQFEGMTQGNINPNELKKLCEDMRKQIRHFNECNQ